MSPRRVGSGAATNKPKSKTVAPQKQEDTDTHKGATSTVSLEQKEDSLKATVSLDKQEDSSEVVATAPLDKQAMVPDVPAAVMVPPDLIVTNERQPRRYFDPFRMESLIASIRKDGILQPLLLRPLRDKYEIVGGERRFKAALSCGLKEVPAVIREMSDTEALEFAIAENLQREDLNAIEETEAILDLLALKLKSDRSGVITLLNRLARIKRGVAYNDVHVERLNIVEEVFTDIGKISRESFRVHRLPLLNLPGDILSALRNGRIEYTKAKEIAKVSDDTERANLLDEAIALSLSVSQIKNKVLAINPPSDGNELTSRVGIVSRVGS